MKEERYSLESLPDDMILEIIKWLSISDRPLFLATNRYIRELYHFTDEFYYERLRVNNKFLGSYIMRNVTAIDICGTETPINVRELKCLKKIVITGNEDSTTWNSIVSNNSIEEIIFDTHNNIEVPNAVANMKNIKSIRHIRHQSGERLSTYTKVPMSVGDIDILSCVTIAATMFMASMIIAIGASMCIYGYAVANGAGYENKIAIHRNDSIADTLWTNYYNYYYTSRDTECKYISVDYLGEYVSIFFRGNMPCVGYTEKDLNVNNMQTVYLGITVVCATIILTVIAVVFGIIYRSILIRRSKKMRELMECEAPHSTYVYL